MTDILTNCQMPSKQTKNKDVMMDQIQEAHEQVSWCLILIDCLLKNVLVNQYIAINMVPPIIQGGQSLD